jgi:hypothetical protein
VARAHRQEVEPGVLEALAELQLELLSKFAVPMLDLYWDDEESSVLAYEQMAAAGRLARVRGFNVAGIGSSRVAVKLAKSAVAKVGWTYEAFGLNIAEAAAWLLLPGRIRRHLAPCVLISEQLVLVQERVDVCEPSHYRYLENGISPEELSSTEEVLAEQRRAFKRFAVRINRQRAATGFTAPADEQHLQVVNYGVHHDPWRVVVVDYGELWPPFEGAWGWLLRRLEDGPVWLDEGERDHLYGELEEHTYVAYPERPTPLSLAERAGLRYAAEDPCPCGSGSLFSKCPAEVCRLRRDEAAWLLMNAAIQTAAQSPHAARNGARPARTVEEAIGEGVVAAAGIEAGEVAGWKFWNGARGGLCSFTDAGLLSVDTAGTEHIAEHHPGRPPRRAEYGADRERPQRQG